MNPTRTIDRLGHSEVADEPGHIGIDGQKQHIATDTVTKKAPPFHGTCLLYVAENLGFSRLGVPFGYRRSGP